MTGGQTPAPQRSRNPPNPAGAPSLPKVKPVLGLRDLPRPWSTSTPLSRVLHQHGVGRCKPEPQAHTTSRHVGWVTPRSQHSTVPAPPAPVGPHTGGSGPAPQIGSPTLGKLGSWEGRLGPHSTGRGGVSGAVAAGPPLVPRKAAAAAASDAASVRRHCGRGGTAGPGLRSRALRGSPLLHPRARALTAPAGARSPGTIGHARVSRRSPPLPRSPPRLPPHSPPLTSGPRPSGVAPLRPCHVTPTSQSQAAPGPREAAPRPRRVARASANGKTPRPAPARRQPMGARGGGV